MASTPRRSLLQRQLLFELSESPFASITSLAKAVRASRPSVSRSIRALETHGLVERQGRKLQLTTAGLGEAALASTRLSADAEEAAEAAGRKLKALSRMGLSDSVASVLNSAFAPVMESFGQGVADMHYSNLEILGQWSRAWEPSSLGLFSTGEAIESLLTSRTFNDSLIPSLSSVDLGVDVATALGVTRSLVTDSSIFASLGLLERGAMESLLGPERFGSGLAAVSAILSPSALDLGGVISPLLDAQEQFSSFISSLSASQSVLDYADIAGLTGRLTEALGHIVEIQRVDASLLAHQNWDWAHSFLISQKLTDVTSSFAEVFRTEVARSEQLNTDGVASRLAQRLELISSPLTHYTGAVLHYVEAEVEQDDTESRHPIPLESDIGNARLDPVLYRLDVNFPAMRQGAWIALASNNPDRLRHAATSQRELMLQLLRLIVPELDIEEDEQPGSKIKARVKAAVGGSESAADYVKSLANAVFAHYSMLNKYTHTNQKHEASLGAILLTGEGLIEYILVNTDLGS
jgi:DNA-binding Lrp family transcriptional regulator